MEAASYMPDPLKHDAMALIGKRQPHLFANSERPHRAGGTLLINPRSDCDVELSDRIIRHKRRTYSRAPSMPLYSARGSQAMPRARHGASRATDNPALADSVRERRHVRVCFRALKLVYW